MKKALDELLHRFLLVKEAEAFLQDTLRPAKLFNTTLKLSDIRWGSHWKYDRSEGRGWIEALYVCEKSFPPHYMRKIERGDLLGATLSMEDLYETLNGSTAEKVSITSRLTD